MRRRVGLYGGSFDPIHWGHIRPVQAAMDQLALDEVLYLPTGTPPHKREQRMAPALARYAMVELALLDAPRLKVSSHELEPGPARYTVETLESFRAAWPGTDFFLLIGGDSFAELQTWRRYAALPALAELAVLARPGVGAGREALAQVAAADPALAAAWEAGRIHVVEGPLLPLASRELRRRLAAGEEPTGEEVPGAVLEYLRKYRLYAQC